jgi:hypothetical protein
MGGPKFPPKAQAAPTVAALAGSTLIGEFSGQDLLDG